MSKKQKPSRALTMDDIARLANVSKPTVSRALSGSPLVTQDTRERVMKVAAAHGYVVNRHARKLRSKRTNTIAVVLDFHSHRQGRVSDPFIFELLIGVAEALTDRNQDLLLCSPSHSEGPSLHSLLSAKGADGLIFLGQGTRHKELVELAKSRTPFVVWGGSGKNQPYCVVGSDNVLGGYLAGRHLLARKRKRFLFIGNTAHLEIELRYQGFLKALKEAGVGKDDLEMLRLDDFSYDGSYAAAQIYLASRKKPADGIFAWSDTAAMAMIYALRAAGRDVPQQVSVIGYNDIPIAAHFAPAITTVRQDVHQAGALLVDKLMAALDGKPAESVTLNTELIIRASS